MALQLTNTLTRRKEEFAPIDAANVRMYVCGPTIYDYAHIGNARPLIVFDVLFRLLRQIYGAEHVTYIRNITDVDDKINARAAERGISIRQLTEETNAIFQADAKALGCLEPSAQPRATEHVAAMIAIVERLLATGHAYCADGHVLFDVPSMPDYGKLSKRPLDEMIAGARVEVAPYKKGPMDFVLWKPSSPDDPGWESPWGRGRPGWHLECSAMSWEYLGKNRGDVFDIHGGGIDLVFPHHENEIAQTCSAFGHDVMANYWVHNGFLQVEGEKMSKSLGNFVTIHELLHSDRFGGRSWSGEVLRLAMLRTHYRQPIDFTVKALEEAEQTLDRWYDEIGDVAPADDISPSVRTALDDDLNTPAALGELHRLSHPAVAGKAMAGLTRFGQKPAPKLLKASANAMGLLLQSGSEYRAGQRASADIDEAEVNRLISFRLKARAAKNWAESDRIRDELIEMGIALKDNKDGTTSWEVKR
jgi:cysteinyl-tRNA synthetase